MISFALYESVIQADDYPRQFNPKIYETYKNKTLF